jgi:hypothetical protein
MPIRITIDLQASRIIVEGEEGDLMGVAKMVKDITPFIEEVMIVSKKPGTNISQNEVKATVDAGNGNVRDLGVKEFAKRFSVNSAVDRICVIAYYLNKIKGNPSFSVKEMDDCFTMCNFQKPAQMAVAMSDAKRKKEYVDSKGRDKWQLTVIGENFVINQLNNIS